jgi:hypothetical protein
MLMPTYVMQILVKHGFSFEPWAIVINGSNINGPSISKSHVTFLLNSSFEIDRKCRIHTTFIKHNTYNK